MLTDKLEKIKIHWQDIEQKLTAPHILNDMKLYKELNKEYKDLKKIVDAYHQYQGILSNIENNKKIINNEKDEEFRNLAKSEIEGLDAEKEKMEEEIRLLLIPKDPEDFKNVLMELRAGTGGDEASIFAGDLYRMYIRFCELKGWRVEGVSESPGTNGGFKEIIFEVSGEEVYGVLKYESGVHRVQRVPATEAQGRIHTSAASVVVLPEADEVDVVIHPGDVKKDVFRASGAGGQHVNKTESAVRVTHIPTGIVVECQDERSQIKNHEKAMKVLRSRIYEKKLQEHLDVISKKRKTMVSTGDRSAKIRTYNYPQGRITDHRIGVTVYNLDSFMNGDIGKMIDALQVAENAEKLKEGIK